MTKITAEDVRKVAKLARLDLPEEQIDTYTQQLEKIIAYVAQLELINTNGIPSTTRAVEVVNVTRNDFVSTDKLREDLLDQAPQREGDFYKVPKILTE